MATPTEQTQITSNIPEWMKPYAMQLLGQAQALSQQGYQPYMVPKTDEQGNIVRDESGQPVMVPGQRTAGFTPQQMQAFQSIAGMQTADQIREATGLAGLAGLDAARLAKYDPAAAQQFYESPEFQRMGVGYRDVAAAPSTQYQMAGVPSIFAATVGAGGMGYESVAAPTGYEAERTRGYEYGPLLMGGAERVGAERFGLGAAREYMSPYMQEVVERQKRGAVQDYLRQLPGIGAASARVGGRGGTREALLESEARRSLSERLGDIEATGLQQAYQQAAQQFGMDRESLLRAALANQAAGLTVGQTNIGAEQARQQFIGGQSLQSQLANQQAAARAAEFVRQQQLQAGMANQQASVTAGQANLQAQMQAALANQQAMMEAQRLNQAAGLTTGQTNLQALINQAQFGAGQGLTAQQLNQAAQLQAQQQALGQLAAANQFGLQNAAQRAQYGLAGANLAEQSRQFGAGLGLQGLQQQLAAAGMLGNLGQQQYQQQMGITQAQLGAGGQQQALEQEMLNVQYQDFLNKQRLPYQQAEFMSGILRGIPATGQTQTMYAQPGSLFGQIAGVGLGLGSLFGGLGSTTGGAATPSDRRLKSNVVRVGTHPLGIGVYEYDIWGLRQRGVMADEVLTVMPEAVSLHENGYMAVRYDMIGGV